MATLRQSLAIERLRLSRREKTGKYKVWFHSAIKRYDHHFKSKESNLFDGKIVKLPSNVDFIYWMKRTGGVLLWLYKGIKAEPGILKLRLYVVPDTRQ